MKHLIKVVSCVIGKTDYTKKGSMSSALIIAFYLKKKYYLSENNQIYKFWNREKKLCKIANLAGKNVVEKSKLFLLLYAKKRFFFTKTFFSA